MRAMERGDEAQMARAEQNYARALREEDHYMAACMAELTNAEAIGQLVEIHRRDS